LHLPAIETVETCFNAVDDNHNRLIDEGCGVAQGQVQVTLAWPESQADFDLFVTDPEGEIAAEKSSTHLGLTLSADCPSSESGCKEQSYENVTLQNEPVTAGVYRVRVRLERFSSGRSQENAQLGVRFPGRTESFSLAFFEVGQEIRMEFSVKEQVVAEPDEDESPFVLPEAQAARIDAPPKGMQP
jgi:hypothetical protein